MRSEIFSAENTAQPATAPGISLQHPRCVKAVVDGEVLARQGVMIGYRGALEFEVKGQGIGNLLKRAITGEGVPLMTVRGRGEVWFARQSNHCFLIDLEPHDTLSISGKHILCFEPTLRYDIAMVQGAGMLGGGVFNCVFTGQGRLAVVSHGQPVVLPVTPAAPVFADTNAVIGWSSHLQTSIRRSQSVNSMLRGGSGELFQIMFSGQGFVVLQPSEWASAPLNA